MNAAKSSRSPTLHSDGPRSTVWQAAEKLLANQREFVTSVLDVAEPYVTGDKPTKKTAATKSTATKPTAA